MSEAERVEERRERFLRAGLEIFGTVGLRKATVRVLCREAGLTERYFYESFADTEALFLAVHQQQSDALTHFFVTELPNLPTDLEARTHAALDLYFSAMRNDRIVRVLYLESLTGSQAIINMYHTKTRQYAEMAAHFIRIDNADVVLPDDYAAQVAMAINGACITLAVQWMLDAYSTPQDTVVKSCALVVLGTLRELRSRLQAAQ